MRKIGADETQRDVVVIGASAGGVDALPRLLAGISRDLPAAVLVVQHLNPSSSMQLVEVVGRGSPLPVAWAEQGHKLCPGRVMIAPPGLHMRIEDDRVTLDRGLREHHARPSIDVLFRTAAQHHANRVVGVLLTGALDDGVAGLAAIDRAGGVVVVQDPDDADFDDMPRHALDEVDVDHVARAELLGPLIDRLVRERPDPPPGLDDMTDEHAAISGTHDAATERALWAAVRSLHQQASKLAELARDSRMVGSKLAARYERKSKQAYDDATRARGFLLERQQRRGARRGDPRAMRASSRGRQA